MIDPPLASDEPYRLRALRRLNQLDSPIDERFERITRLAQRLLHAPIAAISLVDAERQWFKSIQGLDVAETSRMVSFCAHTILGKGLNVVPDARLDPRFSDNPLVTGDPHIVFYAGCPLELPGGSRIGSLCVIDRERHSVTQEDMETLHDLAVLAQGEFAGMLDESARREVRSEMSETKRQVNVDFLTKLWNREAIFSLLEVEIARACRAKTGIGALLVDVDDFKKINDGHGPAIGDEVLRQVAKRMLGSVRPTDGLGRYGGEEFLIVVGSCLQFSDAQHVAERLRQRIAESPIVTVHGSIPVTVSVGLAYCEASEGIIEDSLVGAAAEALYRAKNLGRNRMEATLMPTNVSIVAQGLRNRVIA